MTDVDEIVSRNVTEALNESMPDVVRAAGRGHIASAMLLGASFGAAAVGLGAAIFSSALASTFALFVAIIVLFAALIGTQIAALVIGVRAKRAFTRLAATVSAEHHATLLRVAGRQLHVRAR
jgi:hypothetical protein